MTARRRPLQDRAVALQYHHDMPAPLVVAKGSGAAARRLVELASQHGISVVDRAELANALVMVDIGDYIPEDLYRMVAELLAFINRIEGRTADGSAR